MRFLHVDAPHLGLFEDLNLSKELVLDMGGSVSLQGGSFALASRLCPLVHRVALVSDPASREVTPQQTIDIHARWLLARE